ncbi:hypothetical protein EV182_008771, partial [Spiromyces aspiralis]
MQMGDSGSLFSRSLEPYLSSHQTGEDTPGFGELGNNMQKVKDWLMRNKSHQQAPPALDPKSPERVAADKSRPVLPRPAPGDTSLILMGRELQPIKRKASDDYFIRPRKNRPAVSSVVEGDEAEPSKTYTQKGGDGSGGLDTARAATTTTKSTTTATATTSTERRKIKTKNGEI